MFELVAQGGMTLQEEPERAEEQQQQREQRNECVVGQ